MGTRNVVDMCQGPPIGIADGKRTRAQGHTINSEGSYAKKYTEYVDMLTDLQVDGPTMLSLLPRAPGGGSSATTTLPRPIRDEL